MSPSGDVCGTRSSQRTAVLAFFRPVLVGEGAAGLRGDCRERRRWGKAADVRRRRCGLERNVKIQTTTEVDGSADDLFSFMLDMEKVVPCMPGAHLVGPDGEVEVAVSVGPMSVAYVGRVEIVDSDASARRAVLHVVAAEKRGQGRADATVTLTVADIGDERSRMVSDADVRVTGRVAQMGHGLMQDVATELFNEMAATMERTLRAQPTPARSALPAAARQAPGVSPSGGDGSANGAHVVAGGVKKLSAVRLLLAIAGRRWQRLRARWTRDHDA